MKKFALFAALPLALTIAACNDDTGEPQADEAVVVDEYPVAETADGAVIEEDVVDETVVPVDEVPADDETVVVEE